MGVSIADVPAKVTAPATAVAPCFSANVPAVIVEEFIASLKVAVIF